MNNGAWQFAGVVVTALLTLFGVWLVQNTARAGRRASPYEALERRVLKLEERLETVENENDGLKAKNADLQSTVGLILTDRDSLLKWINHVLRPWIEAGADPPAPSVPDHLADMLPQWVPVKNATRPSYHPPEETT